MKTALYVIKEGYNAIIQNDVELKIVSGIGNILNVQKDSNSEVLSIEVDKVQKFLTIK